MQETRFRKVVFELWAFRFFFTLEQLIEDGVELTEVLNYFSENAEDVGFIWRSSYTGHLRKVNYKSKSGNIFKESLRVFRNRLNFVKLLLLYRIGITKTISTRSMCLADFYSTISEKPTFFINRLDQVKLVKNFSRIELTDFWIKKFLFHLNSGQYKISSPTQQVIEQKVSQLLPSIFLISMNSSPHFFKRAKLVNFGGDIFKSNVLFALFWRHYAGEITGAQHGGGYGIVKSRMLDAEIKSYGTFFMRKLEPASAIIAPKNKVYLDGNPGIILVASMPYEKMEASWQFRHFKDFKIIGKKREKLRKILKTSDIPLYMREHPKSNISSYCNTRYFDRGSHKPVIWGRNRDLIILEAPGTTTEISCIKYNLPYICVFDITDFELTNEGMAHYHALKANNKLFSVEEVRAAITKKFKSHN